ncbi:MAG: hypothetical protein OSB12_09155, partial [Planctomycetota bacterium]|nr:hypothetical protein [Planctomycetota bacterium]
WKAVAVLNDCASWIDAGIAACGQMSARCVSLEEADPATADHEKQILESMSKNLWIAKEGSWEKIPYESLKYNHYLNRYFDPVSDLSSNSDMSGYASFIDSLDPPLKNVHNFWSFFFIRGVPIHPELANKKPTGGGRKIGPTILPGIQIDVAYSSRGVSCRLLSMKPEKLKPLLKLKSQFSEAVDGEIEWNDGSKNRSHLSVTVRPASNREQQGWSIEEKVVRLLKLYGQIKKFVIKNLE